MRGHYGEHFCEIVLNKSENASPELFATHKQNDSNFDRNLTHYRSSKIHYQPSPTARNGSQDMRQPEMSKGLLTSVF